MKEIDKETKAKRNEEYNKKARKYPAYLSLAIPIVLGVAMGVKDMTVSSMWVKGLTYLISISTISTALFFLLRFTLRDISRFYPGRILFCDRFKPSTRLLYSDDTTCSEEKKAEIRTKIKFKKNMDLQKFKNKTYKNKNYVKRVDEAVDWLLDVTRFDDILFEYNCLYGFWRNLTAALLVDAILVFGLAAVNNWLFPLPFGTVLHWIGIIILLLTVITTIVAYRNGRTFAKKMYDVFLNLDEDKENY